MEKKARMRVVLVLVAVMLASILQEAYAGRSRSPGTSGLSKGVMGCNILGKCDKLQLRPRLKPATGLD
uniref:Uncharacterized protein n=1 Tax=Oryza meridionalis TaxID=40149 RepID=A0A0E0CJQ9_9ORYZ